MQHYHYVYLLGIGGIGMSALARWMHHLSRKVFGYDSTPSTLTASLVKEGIPISFDNSPAAIPPEILQNKAQSLVVYTPAIPASNPILHYFRTQGYAVCKRAEIVGALTQDFCTVAVAGTHGKTTSTALVTHILHQARKSIIALVGGILQDYNTNFITHGSPTKDTVVVVEADEFDRSFLHLHPDLAIITTVDADHLDIYSDQPGVYSGFQAFIQRLPTTQQLIIHQKAAQALSLTSAATRYAFTNAPVHAENVHHHQGYCQFDYISPQTILRNLRLASPGHHQIENALAVITACLALGINEADIRKGIHTFPGIKRRFEYIMQHNKLVFIDDYAHHPTEITALLQGLRAHYPNQKITIIFQPHTYTRTRDFAAAFAQSLDLADQVLLLDIYPAREEPIPGITSALIRDQMQLQSKRLCTKAQVLEHLAQEELTEVIVTVGAGDIATLVAPIREQLLQRIEARAATAKRPTEA